MSVEPRGAVGSRSDERTAACPHHREPRVERVDVRRLLGDLRSEIVARFYERRGWRVVLPEIDLGHDEPYLVMGRE